MPKRHKAQWGWKCGGTVKGFPFYTDYVEPVTNNVVKKIVEIEKSKEKTQPDKEKAIDTYIVGIVKELPFWLNHDDIMDKIRMARKTLSLKEFATELTAIIESPEGIKFTLLEKSLGAKITMDNRDALNEAANKFLMVSAKAIPPSLNQSKAACKKIADPLRKAVDMLERIDRQEDQTKDRLCSISPKANLYISNIEVLIDGLTSIEKAAEQLGKKKNIKTGLPFQHAALWSFIADLAPIYTEITGERATASVGQHSNFVKFVILCVELILETKDKLDQNLDSCKALGISLKYSGNSINNIAVKIVALLKLKRRQEESIGDDIPLTETGEGMLKALHEAREKNKTEELEFIKKLKKR